VFIFACCPGSVRAEYGWAGFLITERFRAIFTFDAFNVFNHTYFTSVSTQEYKYALTGDIPTLTPINGFGAGSATQGFPDGTNARRLQLGLRLNW
jgi:hypothetical protein